MLTLSRKSTVGEVARKIMGDVPINYIEGVGGTRVSEDDIVAVGKHDVSSSNTLTSGLLLFDSIRSCPSRLVGKLYYSAYVQSQWNNDTPATMRQ